MQFRTFGRTGWQVSEIGYGMWGMAGWTGSDDDDSRQALQLAVDLGCNFFDTAWAYGDGHSERLLGELVRANPDKTLYTATKIPPKNRIGRRARQPRSTTFPRRAHPRIHREEPGEPRAAESQPDATPRLGRRLGEDERWQRALDDLKRQGLIQAVGISINRWEPANALRTLRTGLDRRRAGDLQHLRPGPGGRAVSPVPRAERRRDRPRALRRRHA